MGPRGNDQRFVNWSNFRRVNGAMVTTYGVPSRAAAIPSGCQGVKVPSFSLRSVWCHGFGLPSGPVRVT